MISVLIPVFNIDVSELVRELYSQLSKSNVVFEVIILDDKSEERYRAINQRIKGKKIIYIESEINYGRTLVRQQLVKKASFEWVLLIDGDSLIDESFIDNYLNSLLYQREEVDIMVGGTKYQQKPPKDCKLHLHWTYGSQREKLDIKKRSRLPYHGFICNNIVIKKAVFDQLTFSETLQGYGHEDTLIGIQLEQFKAAVLYIDNPVIHNGIETTAVFLKKTHSALENLLLLEKTVNKAVLRKHVKLYNLFYWQKKLLLTPLLKITYNFSEAFIRSRLNRCHPPLRLFDFYRLHFLIQLSKQKETAI